MKPQPIFSLERAVKQKEQLMKLSKADIRQGDIVIVKTINSVYYIRSVLPGLFKISGGWFDRTYKNQIIVGINGCSWGGSVINIDLIAACGLSIEFSNRVVTSTVQQFYVFRYENTN